MVVDALLAHGVTRVFGVPGESYLPILDALYDVRHRLTFVPCRHEHGASMMADAHGKLTGRPGVCLVTRGPGACNAAIGVHVAFQDSTPMVLLVGQVQRRFLGREAFQEVDFEGMFGPLAKHAEQVDWMGDLPDALSHAFYLACSGRPGPVVLALPEDLLSERAAIADAPPLTVEAPDPDHGRMVRLGEMLAVAQRPMLLLGGSRWTEQARADIVAFAEAHALPVCCGFRRHDLFHAEHPAYSGELGIGANPALIARVRGADLLLAVGTRLGEATSQGYTLLEAGEGAGPPMLVHVHPDPAELGRVFSPALAIEASPAPFAAAARLLPATATEERIAWVAAARDDYLADSTPEPSDAALDLGRAMRELDEGLPEDAIVTVDAGNYSGWPQRFLRIGRRRRLLGPCNGAMGYSVPAAIAAKLSEPARTVVATVGDGSFGMTGGELSTAVAHAAGILVLIFDNGQYGTIRGHQEREYPGRVIGTGLTNPDFAALARSYGIHAEAVGRTDEFALALARALEVTRERRPALLALACDPQIISTRTTIARLREAAVGKGKP